MISKQIFKQQMMEITSLLGIDSTPNYFLALYKHIANEFTDEEFINACHQVMINEDLYGKMPTARHFTKYLPKQPTEDDEREAKKQAFLEKVSNYLMLDFVMDYDRRKFDNITELESRALRVNGGLSEMWSRVHNLDYPCKISTIIKELGEFYDNNYTRESVEQHTLLTDRRRGELTSFGELFLEKVN